ncbi:DNA/RNA-binding protein KIN17-like [Tigriopus californicus]|uniref:DNA/RNA-binding protein KIN17-like n=1 Tax=Tigriopus californicus TaxID=6832 RepID=UPI0027DA6FC3|nr:DNA/RNA-binding protein KIN17-like [Tigriopus californicus]
MGKAEAGTPKWLANKMKSKGLQKLRWFCQMCNKQCRDENGFKCHTQSEAHQRQLLLFADNPNKFLSNYSVEFEKDFLYLLKRCHGTKRVKANKVYQSYIAEKDHIHMNATRWETLTGFVQYLGRTGKCLVDQTEEGWFITWIDRDPETIARQETRQRAARKKLSSLHDEKKRKKSALEEIKEEEERQKKSKRVGHKSTKTTTEPKSIKNYWLKPNIVVKIVTRSLGEQYYKQKGYVHEVVDKYAAVVILFQLDKKLKLDQAHLETVIPAEGQPVLILNGQFRGETAILQRVDVDSYSAYLQLNASAQTVKLPYEHFSKLCPASNKS